MKFLDYYKILGVRETDDADTIKKAYRRLARKYHPDVSKEPDAEDKFKRVGEAYEVLKDPEKRAEYDNLRKYGANTTGEFRPPPGWQSRSGFSAEDLRGFGGLGGSGFSDFFEAIFGARGPQARAGFADFGTQRGGEFGGAAPPQTHRIGVTLEESYHGATRQITLRGPDPRGGQESKTLSVRIPRGVTHGQRIRLRGQGGAGPGGGRADLYLEIALEPHRVFNVEGKDISLTLPVAPWEAALGTTVAVPTLGGRVNVSIPANARSGQKLRLKSRGLPGDPPGDQFVMVQIALPEVTTEKQRAFMEQMRREMPFDPRQAIKY